jgi:hypothetical protein
MAIRMSHINQTLKHMAMFTWMNRHLMSTWQERMYTIRHSLILIFTHYILKYLLRR